MNGQIHARPFIVNDARIERYDLDRIAEQPLTAPRLQASWGECGHWHFPRRGLVGPTSVRAPHSEVTLPLQFSYNYTYLSFCQLAFSCISQAICTLCKLRIAAFSLSEKEKF